jgi:hypothetical protein
MKHIFIILFLFLVLVIFEIFRILKVKKNQHEGYYGGIPGNDYPYNDIANYPNTFQVNCMRYCDSNPNCYGIVTTNPALRDWSRPDNHNCWLKSKFENKTPNDDRIAFYKINK